MRVMDTWKDGGTGWRDGKDGHTSYVRLDPSYFLPIRAGEGDRSRPSPGRRAAVQYFLASGITESYTWISSLSIGRRVRRKERGLAFPVSEFGIHVQDEFAVFTKQVKVALHNQLNIGTKSFCFEVVQLKLRCGMWFAHVKTYSNH
jgi:hypothetical protein